MDRVTVFRFLVYDEGTSAQTLSTRCATEQTIGRIMDAALVVASAQIVAECRIDKQGFLIDGAP